MKNQIVSCLAAMAGFVVLPCYTDSYFGIQKNMDKTVAFMVPPHHPGVTSDSIAFMVPPHHPGVTSDSIAFMVPPHHPGVTSDGIAFMVPPHHPGGNANGVAC